MYKTVALAIKNAARFVTKDSMDGMDHVWIWSGCDVLRVGSCNGHTLFVAGLNDVSHDMHGVPDGYVYSINGKLAKKFADHVSHVGSVSGETLPDLFDSFDRLYNGVGRYMNVGDSGSMSTPNLWWTLIGMLEYSSGAKGLKGRILGECVASMVGVFSAFKAFKVDIAHRYVFHPSSAVRQRANVALFSGELWFGEGSGCNIIVYNMCAGDWRDE